MLAPSPSALLPLLLLSAPSFSRAQQRNSNSLLNAYHAPLSALSAPRSHYFLEFPALPPNPENVTALAAPPRCEDGSPYGFLFRRGTDAHLNKLLVEFEGASGRATSTPWDALRRADNLFGDSVFPPLGSCTGLTEGFLSLGASLVGFGGSMASSGEDADLPIFLRGHPDITGDENSTARPSKKVWWEHLGGDHTSVHDWSYLLVPHCTPSSPSAAANNVHKVTDWVTSRYAKSGGLDALVAVSGGGRIGGCSLSTVGVGGAADFTYRLAPAESFSSLTALSFARDVSTAMSSSSDGSSRALVVVDGATLWNGNNGVSDATLDALAGALSTDVHVAWVASTTARADQEEVDFFIKTVQSHPGLFHVHRPSSKYEDAGALCPLYAFSDASANDLFSVFMRSVAGDMPWGGVATNEVQKDEDDATVDDSARLSFLAIFLILFGGYALSWIVYFLVECIRKRRTKDAVTPTPHDMWFLALTRFPVAFLVASVLIPVILSYVAYEREGGVTVNLDFDSYLDIDTLEERTAMQYKDLVDYQKESLKEEEGNCKLLYDGNFTGHDPKRERALEKTDGTYHHDEHHRGLQEYGKRNGRTVISFFYQNRDGGTVFTPEVLRSIRKFEEFLMTVPGFDELCYGDGKICYPFNSIVPYFYPDGENLVEDMDIILKSFPGSKIALAKMDKYFSKQNLGSNVTLTNVMLNDVNGSNRAKVHRFLESLHRVLWDLDQGQRYPNLIISWSNGHMQNVEAADALEHDFKWSLAALTFIGLMVFVKVRNVFLVLAGVLGLVLSFTSAMYWQYHFDFDQLTAMHVAGIFVMLGIGADDIFLTIDSFEHTKVDFIGTGLGGVPNLDDPDIIKQRMVSSYKTAGSMLLVSSVTTAICFFSNIFSALVAIADFGSYMGMVVVLNYIHVMTILPSAIIVNEVHIKPLRRKIWRAICCSKSNGREELRETDAAVAVDAETGIGVTVSSSCVGEEQSVSENGTRQQTSDYYKFLDHTEEMSTVDRYFVQHHAPFVYRWRKAIVFASLFVAIILGVLAWLNFTLYDGTIIVFKEQYNLGRVQRVIDEYFPEGLVRKYTDEGIDFVGNNDGVSVSAEDIDNSFGGSDVLDILVDAGGTKPAPTTSATTRSPATAGPSSRPTLSLSPTPTGAQEQTSTGVNSTLPPTARPSLPAVSVPPPPSSVGSPPAPAGSGVNSSPQEKWYPSWTGDIRGCFNDGLQPSYLTDDFLLDTKVKCCDKYFALDTNPGNCLDIDNYITAFKCDGADFNPNPNPIVRNTPFHICVKSMSSNVDIDVLNSMVITQGDSDLTLINNGATAFPSFTSTEFVEAHNGVVVSTHAPANVFDYNIAGSPIKVTGGVVVRSGIGAKLDSSEEAFFEINANLRQESAPAGTFPGPGPTVSGPTVSGPTVSGPSPSTPQSNVNVPSPSPWYPDWTARVCRNDGRHPSYFEESPGSFLFDELVDCCEKNFAGDQSACLGINAIIPTTNNPTNRPSKNPTLSPTVTTSPSLLPTAQPSESLPPTDRRTPLPTHQPSKAPSVRPSSKPTSSPVKDEKNLNCPPGLSGKYCLQTSGAKKTYKKREYYAVSIVWGMRPIRSDPNVWLIRDYDNQHRNEALDNTLNSNYIDPSDANIQEWLLEIVTLARNDTALRLHPQPTWIEALKDFADENGIGFPIPKGLFIGVVDLMKMRSSFFLKLVEREIATKNPGIHGEFLFTSLSVLSEVPAAYTSELALDEWTNFTDSVNEMLPEGLPPTNAQSDVFIDSLRTSAIVDSTLSSYFFANGLYLVIILFFTGNFLLTLMVMTSLLLILLSFAGLTFFAFQIEFGPVESLGVSIFVGLSANYLLHIAHSYHKSNIKEHDVKIQRAVFVTGSPILWSALSTIGGSMFLFACRTWLLTELGILICVIIGLSLICSVGFLLALLAFIGPLPIVSDGDIGHNLHSCDLMTVFNIFRFHKNVRQAQSDPAITPAEEAEVEVERSLPLVLVDEASISGDTAASF